MSDLRLPDDLRYTKEHEWARPGAEAAVFGRRSARCYTELGEPPGVAHDASEFRMREEFDAVGATTSD